MSRLHNFNAGPAALPLPVLERCQREMIDYEASGMSIMEHSHRGAVYDKVHREAESLLRKLMQIDDSYEVLFLQGGASLQFAMLPMNLLPAHKSADYVITGTWAKKALAEAKRIGRARAAADMYVDGGCTAVPSAAQIDVDPAAAYLHVTSNNTISGTQIHDWKSIAERSADVPLIVDMSSDIMWRPMDMGHFDMIYAGAQKNIGPSGLAIVIIKKTLLERAREDAPNILRYAIHVEKRSLYNTPNSFGIYMVRNVLSYLNSRGGLGEMERCNREKADMLYAVIDDDSDFFRCPVAKDSRSVMNVVFRLPSEELEKSFLEQAQASQLNGLKGHRSVGGIRASIYNAVPIEAVAALTTFMKAFRSKN